MNAIIYILRQLYGYYEKFRETWPMFSAWLVVAPVIVLLTWFVLSFPILALIGMIVWAAEVRFSKAI